MKCIMHLTKASLLFSSSNPQKLARFYALLLDGSSCNGYTRSDFVINIDYPCQFKFFKPSTLSDSDRITPPSFSICFHKNPSPEPLRVIEQWIIQISSIGGKLIESPRNDDFGAEAWMSDEQDNKFLLFVPFCSS